MQPGQSTLPPDATRSALEENLCRDGGYASLDGIGLRSGATMGGFVIYSGGGPGRAQGIGRGGEGSDGFPVAGKQE